MKKRLLLLAAAAVAVVVVSANPGSVYAQNPGPAISINVSPSVVGAFKVDVVNGVPATGFSAYNVRLTFDATKLAVVTATYNPTANPPVSAQDMTFPPGVATCPAPLVDNVGGSVSFGCVSGPPTGIFTAGTLARFFFVSRAGPGGPVTFHLTTQVEMGMGGTLTFDPDGTAQSNALTDGSSTVPQDTDGDGLPDVIDPCPLTADCDGDGVSDGPLAPVSSGLIPGPDNCPTVANGPAQAAISGVGNQTNTDGGNSALGLAGQDTLGDACDPDISGDGYTNAQKTAAGKSIFLYCNIRRADVNMDGLVTIGDFGKVAAYFGKITMISVDYAGQPFPPPNPPGATAPERYNQNGDTLITIGDLGKMALVFGKNVSQCP
ncbi:MAG TPA: thrombospondin type 3 repeat-containing protein [Dehalococcoidia bacterium]|nr:thrombospondin type 3 repeat-containing protein [Dehalococcoidia bacterium]